jgi:hypothetical protein
MTVAKPLVTKIADASAKFLFPTPEAAVVKDGSAHVAEQLHGGNVISKISRQAFQSVASYDAKAIALKTGFFEETGPGAGKRAVVPGALPPRIASIDPGITILRAHCNSGTQ